MGQQVSRLAFDSFLTKTHVQHALIQPDGRHNDIPTVSMPTCTQAMGVLVRLTLGRHSPLWRF
jgi:hypothetical protein